MAGGLMQLVAYGAQDVYLTGNPQITFWKVTYRRHTNFAMESIEQTFNGQADFGRRVTCTISRNGDLAYRTYLQITLPEIGQSLSSGAVYARWLDFPGEQLISQVEVEIGGQRIDRQYGDWMHIWNQLTLSKEQERGYFKMVGNTTQLTYVCDPNFAAIDGPCSANGVRQVCAPRDALPETTLYVPLQFWYCRNPGLALPLIALQYHEVKINLDIRNIEECLWAVSAIDGTGTKITDAYKQSLAAASLFVDYIFLDTDERRRMAQNPHEYLIEQLQFTGDESVGSSSNKIKLNLNHPCKELIWVVQPDANVDYCSSLTASTHLNNLLGAQPFNYTDAFDALPNAVHAFGGQASASGANAVINASGLFEDPFSNDIQSSVLDSGAATGADSGVSDAGTFVLAETALDMHCWGENPVIVAKLQLNGQDRFSEREGTYFDLVQPYQHHTRAPDSGINVYSFALHPEEHQPSGTCNFSRIDNATLQLVLSNATVQGVNTAKVRVYAVNYNVLRIMSGMGGLAYSN
uniref:Major capsid protein n=1 Tax=Phaeocystis pouchetii virus TaxID=455365 RepID=MCP_PPV01|nr:RecName: Full=Major capsid protein; Short=MCP [Phaeocystis pouchetii virus]ABU23715.1 putative major capsid protein [Phaeocystis pouchetii virus]